MSVSLMGRTEITTPSNCTLKSKVHYMELIGVTSALLWCRLADQRLRKKTREWTPNVWLDPSLTSYLSSTLRRLDWNGSELIHQEKKVRFPPEFLHAIVRVAKYCVKWIKSPQFLLSFYSLASTNNIVNGYTLGELFHSKHLEKKWACSGIKHGIVYTAGQSDGAFGNIYRVKLLTQGQIIGWPKTHSTSGELMHLSSPQVPVILPLYLYHWSCKLWISLQNATKLR